MRHLQKEDGLSRLAPCLVTCLALAACGDNIQTLGADAGEAEITGQGSPARGDLVINEVSPAPESGPDWIEILNRSSEAIDLCHYFLTDSIDRLDHYLFLGGAVGDGDPGEGCEPEWIDAGEYRVYYADDQAELGSDHAPFKLGRADAAYLVTVNGEAADSFLYLYPADDEGLSLSRYPDGEGLFWLGEQTKFEPNAPGIGAEQSESEEL